MTEIVRGGIQSVDKGQMEASRSLGIGYFPTMRKVVLPQAVTIDDPVVRQPVRHHAQGHLDPVGDRHRRALDQGRQIYRERTSGSKMWLIVGIIYFVVIMALTKLSDRSKGGSTSERIP